MRVVGTNVLVRVEQEEEQKTNSGLYIPKTVEQSYSKGEVISIGQAVGFEPEIKVGDIVVFPRVDEKLIYEGMYNLPYRDISFYESKK